MPVRAVTLRQYMDWQARGTALEWDYLIDAMHKDRARTFKKRLGWQVEVDELGWEIDEFDTWEVNPLYLIAVNEEGEYQGSCRLLPTTGPNMLRDVFPQLLDEGAAAGDVSEPRVIEHPNTWESSRITAEPEVFPELIAAIGEVALKSGITHVVTVVDERVKRLLRVLRCPAEVVGTPCEIGGIECCALMITDPHLSEMRARCKLPERVLL